MFVYSSAYPSNPEKSRVLALATRRISLDPHERYNIKNWEIHEKSCKWVQQAMSSGPHWRPKAGDRSSVLNDLDKVQLAREREQRLGLYHSYFRELAEAVESKTRSAVAVNAQWGGIQSSNAHTTRAAPPQRTSSSSVVMPPPLPSTRMHEMRNAESNEFDLTLPRSRFPVSFVRGEPMDNRGAPMARPAPPQGTSSSVVIPPTPGTSFAKHVGQRSNVESNHIHPAPIRSRQFDEREPMYHQMAPTPPQRTSSSPVVIPPSPPAPSLGERVGQRMQDMRDAKSSNDIELAAPVQRSRFPVSFARAE
ncbi:hypothetical protein MPER_13033 [Moniliophthora perniciosa FA553]|nr:hypothetical protein MPER_13033 [Moniliophthora perniciosa FA553]